MEWLVLAVVVALAALFVAWPRRADVDPPAVEVTDLREERLDIIAELREIEEDFLAGRITADDRVEARRGLGVRLRRVTEALREYDGEPAGHS